MLCRKRKQEEERVTELGWEGPTSGEVAREDLSGDAMSVERERQVAVSRVAVWETNHSHRRACPKALRRSLCSLLGELY